MLRLLRVEEDEVDEEVGERERLKRLPSTENTTSGAGGSTLESGPPCGEVGGGGRANPAVCSSLMTPNPSPLPACCRLTFVLAHVPMLGSSSSSFSSSVDTVAPSSASASRFCCSFSSLDRRAASARREGLMGGGPLYSPRAGGGDKEDRALEALRLLLLRL